MTGTGATSAGSSRRRPAHHQTTTPGLAARAWRTCFPGWAALLVFVFTGVLAPVLLVSLHVAQNPTFSPLDEINHYDYVTRLAAGGFPRLGQNIQPSSLQMFECTGIAYPPEQVPPCGTPYGPGVGQILGTAVPQYEAQQPPLYYLATVPMRWVAIHAFGFGDLAGTRLLGLVWLVSGLLFVWAACRVVGVAPTWIGAGILLLATAPLVVYSTANVTNDAGGVFAGGAVLLAGAMAWRHPGRWMVPVLFLVGLLAPAIKAVDVLAVVAVSAVLLLRELSADAAGPTWSERLRRWVPSGGALIAGGLVAAVGWELVNRTIATADPATIPTWQVLRGKANGITDILRESTSMWSPLTSSYAPFHATHAGVIESARAVNLAAVAATVLAFLAVAGGLGGLFVARRTWSHALGLVTMATLFCGGIALGYAIHYSYKVDPGVNGRYGLALAPMLVVALVASARGDWVRRGLWAVGLLTLVVDCYAMVAT